MSRYGDFIRRSTEILFQEERSHRPRWHTRQEARPIDMITSHHSIIMIIISQIRSRHTHLQLAAIHVNLNLALKVRRIDNRDRQGAICVFKRTDVQGLRGAVGINANGTRAREAEESSKGVKAARNFDAVVSETDEDGVAAGSCAAVVLRAPPVEVSRSISVDKSVVPTNILV
jgi:hypothetical protein